MVAVAGNQDSESGQGTMAANGDGGGDDAGVAVEEDTASEAACSNGHAVYDQSEVGVDAS